MQTHILDSKSPQTQIMFILFSSILLVISSENSKHILQHVHFKNQCNVDEVSVEMNVIILYLHI